MSYYVLNMITDYFARILNPRATSLESVFQHQSNEKALVHAPYGAFEWLPSLMWHFNVVVRKYLIHIECLTSWHHITDTNVSWYSASSSILSSRNVIETIIVNGCKGFFFIHVIMASLQWVEAFVLHYGNQLFGGATDIWLKQISHHATRCSSIVLANTN